MRTGSKATTSTTTTSTSTSTTTEVPTKSTTINAFNPFDDVETDTSALLQDGNSNATRVILNQDEVAFTTEGVVSPYQLDVTRKRPVTFAPGGLAATTMAMATRPPERGSVSSTSTVIPTSTQPAQPTVFLNTRYPESGLISLTTSTQSTTLKLKYATRGPITQSDQSNIKLTNDHAKAESLQNETGDSIEKTDIHLKSDVNSQAPCSISSDLTCLNYSQLECFGFGQIICLVDTNIGGNESSSKQATDVDDQSTRVDISRCKLAPTLRCKGHIRGCRGRAVCRSSKSEDQEAKSQLLGPLSYWEVGIIAGFAAVGGFILIGLIITIIVS